jgi:hypothetical protein
MSYTVTVNTDGVCRAHFNLTEKEALELEKSAFEHDPHAEIVWESVEEYVEEE